MKLFIQSDQHNILHKEIEPKSTYGADVFICAGDLGGSAYNSVQWLADNIDPNTQVIFVPGNHEYFLTSIASEYARAKLLADTIPNIHLLDNDTKQIENIRFIGCTLWADYGVLNNRAEAIQFQLDNGTDFKRIKFSTSPDIDLTPQHILALNAISQSYLEAALSTPFDGKTIVVTHHGPHPQSINPKYAQSMFVTSYCSDLSGLIEKHQPDMWIHGHMHDGVSYHLGKTHVLSNPRGYAHEGAGFRSDLVLEV